MIKIICIVCVFSACIYISKILTKSLKIRLVVLNCFYRDMCFFKDLATKQGKDILSIFKLLSVRNNCLANIYIDVYENAHKKPNTMINKLWYDSVNLHAKNTISDIDLEIISEFSHVLDSLKSIGLGEIMEKYESDLLIYIKENKKDISKKTSMYEKFGFIIGAFFGILLL